MNNKTNTKRESQQQPKSRKFRQFGRLAQRYYPDRGYKRAVALFREEIKITGGLQKALEQLGYHDSQRILSPRQVQVIEKYLGES